MIGKFRRQASRKFDFQSDLIGAVAAIAPVLCTPPKLEKAKKVLFVQAHPGDDILYAGGAIADLVSKGADCRELTFIGEENPSAIKAQNKIGLKNAGFLGYPKNTDANVHEISRKICDIIREMKPDFVITADPMNSSINDPDTIRLGYAVKFGCMDSECNFYPEFQDGKLRDDAFKVPGIGFYNTDKPNSLYDITVSEQQKYEVLEIMGNIIPQGSISKCKEEAVKSAGESRAKAVEPFRLQNGLQMHCFNLPIKKL